MFTLAVRREKKAFYSKKLDNKNGKDLWKSLKVIGLGRETQNDTQLSENLSDISAMNDYFINCVPNMNPNLTLKNLYSHNCRVDVEANFSCVEESDVLNVIKSIKSAATGYDKINILTINMCLPFLLPYLTHIINACILRAEFPSMWKVAKIIPVPKTTNPTGYNEIRPISILPTFSKILEKILNQQLQVHLSQHKVLPENQSGFRRDHSCTSALLKITDDIFDACDNGLITVLILLDYSKAFDTLDHSLLTSMFKYIGMSQRASDMISSYLSNRSQAVHYNGRTSNYLNTNKGVPQGSILGPKLFSIYTSNFPANFLSCNQHYFADDTQIYLSFKPDESEQAVAAINYDLERVYQFSTSHCLRLNNNKSVGIVFGSAARREIFLRDFAHMITIDNSSIEFKETVKNLGLHIDQNLRFGGHVAKCLQKSYLNLKFLFQSRHIFTKKIKKIAL